jgi:hypothetical protein
MLLVCVFATGLAYMAQRKSRRSVEWTRSPELSPASARQGANSPDLVLSAAMSFARMSMLARPKPRQCFARALERLRLANMRAEAASGAPVNSILREHSCNMRAKH